MYLRPTLYNCFNYDAIIINLHEVIKISIHYKSGLRQRIKIFEAAKIKIDVMVNLFERTFKLLRQIHYFLLQLKCMNFLSFHYYILE